MSWSDRTPLARSFSAVAALLVVSVGLSGCFSPMYLGAGGNLGAQLRAISVDPVPDNLGHYLRDQLITNLNGTGDSAAAKYRLQLTSAERVQTALIDIVTQRAQDATVVTDITYKLIPIQGGAPLVSGTVTSAAVYDRSAPTLCQYPGGARRGDPRRQDGGGSDHDADRGQTRRCASGALTRLVLRAETPRGGHAG